MAPTRTTILVLSAVARLAAATLFAPIHDYLSRPDIKVPRLFVDFYNESGVAPGYLFMSPFYPELHPGKPSGADGKPTANFYPSPMIFDNYGDLVWSGFNQTGNDEAPFRIFGSMGFERCEHDGRPHLCYAHYQPMSPIHHDILNEHYETVSSIWAEGTSDGRPLLNDTHEFNIKLANEDAVHESQTHETAIITSTTVRKLVKPIHHRKCNITMNWVQSSVFQDIVLSTREVLFQWDSFDHIPLQDSHCPGNDGFWRPGDTPERSWDHFHMNAVDRDRNGDYYISGRHTSTIYKISGQDGSILWAIGEMGNFTMLTDIHGTHPEFGFQHHLRLQEDYPGYDLSHGVVVLSIYDNSNDRYDFSTKTAQSSKGKIFVINEREQTATLKEAYPLFQDPRHQLSTNQGSFQLLPNGNRMLGGGNVQEVIEWQSGNPQPVFLAHWGDWEHADGSLGNKINSYRSLRFEWKGFPTASPDLFTFAPECGANMTSYLSWNGATEVISWEVWGSDVRDGAYQRIGKTSRNGFETQITSKFTNFVVAIARDSYDNELGRSTPTRVAVLNPNEAYGATSQSACGGERCEPGFDYATRAAQDCSVRTTGSSSSAVSGPDRILHEQGSEHGYSVWLHCDPCFGPFKALWEKYMGSTYRSKDLE